MVQLDKKLSESLKFMNNLTACCNGLRQPLPIDYMKCQCLCLCRTAAATVGA